MKTVEPNYQVVLIIPTDESGNFKEFNLLIPTVTDFSTLLNLVIQRQGLDPNLNWQIFDERYPNDVIDFNTYPLLANYHGYRGNNRGVLELKIQEQQ